MGESVGGMLRPQAPPSLHQPLGQLSRHRHTDLFIHMQAEPSPGLVCEQVSLGTESQDMEGRSSRSGKRGGSREQGASALSRAG